MLVGDDNPKYRPIETVTECAEESFDLYSKIQAHNLTANKCQEVAAQLDEDYFQNNKVCHGEDCHYSCMTSY